MPPYRFIAGECRSTKGPYGRHLSAPSGETTQFRARAARQTEAVSGALASRAASWEREVMPSLAYVLVRFDSTVRTVESNLTRTYAKLGITSRSQLAARLAKTPETASV